MTQKLKWGGVPDVPPPKRPVRDTLLVYGGLAIVIVVIAWLTGGSVGNALVIAAFFFVVACSWTIWRFRVRAREETAQKNEGA
jgi:membrane protein implicated in regulation of membrane protease activity